MPRIINSYFILLGGLGITLFNIYCYIENVWSFAQKGRGPLVPTKLDDAKSWSVARIDTYQTRSLGGSIKIGIATTPIKIAIETRRYLVA